MVDTERFLFSHPLGNYLTAFPLILRTWREYVWVEADVETCVADGTHCLACIQDHLLTFGVCYE